MTENKKTKEQIWHENEAKKFQQDMEEGKVTVVGSTKDLKPDSFIEFNLIICILLGGKNPLLQKEALMKLN